MDKLIRRPDASYGPPTYYKDSYDIALFGTMWHCAQYVTCRPSPVFEKWLVAEKLWVILREYKRGLLRGQAN